TKATKIEAVFKNTYYTIAATFTKDLTEGFLNRLEEKGSRYIIVPKSLGGKVYICISIINDFDSDVIKGVLNTRA
ncbi:hypothetical protein BKA64DRAFT_570291, partial [Cadophora sp. MPI-SDFR-AT-0126]